MDKLIEDEWNDLNLPLKHAPSPCNTSNDRNQESLHINPLQHRVCARGLLDVRLL